MWHNSSILYRTFYRGSPFRKAVALTFDDGPAPGFTPLVLDILKQYDVKATFFCVGSLAEKYPEIVSRIHNDGHLVANHSYEHNWNIHLWDTEKVQRSIIKSGEALRKITGYFPRLLRTPVGIKTPAQALLSWNMGLTFIGWTQWAFDGGRQTLSMKKTQRIIKSTKNGDIILLHDGKLSAKGEEIDNNSHYSAIKGFLPKIIEDLKAEGFEFDTLDKLLDIPGQLDNVNNHIEHYRPKRTLKLFKALIHSFLNERKGTFKLLLALAVGIFIGCSPFWGLHTFLGLVAAIKLRLNRLAIIAGSKVSNRVTGLFIIIASIQAGWLVLNGSWLTMSSAEIQTGSFIHLGGEILNSWLTGFPIIGAITALSAWGLVCLMLLFYRSR